MLLLQHLRHNRHRRLAESPLPRQTVAPLRLKTGIVLHRLLPSRVNQGKGFLSEIHYYIAINREFIRNNFILRLCTSLFGAAVYILCNSLKHPFAISRFTLFLAPGPRLTKEGASHADGDRLGLDVVVEGSLAELAADTRLLEATEGHLVVKHVVACCECAVSIR